MLTIEVELGGPQPVYRQIADQVRGLIAKGELHDGAQLPSVRDLAASVGVNLNTVAKAYRILADEGHVDLRHGARVRVRRGTAARAPELESLTRQLLDVVSRLVLQGAERVDVQHFFDGVIDDFFSKRTR